MIRGAMAFGLAAFLALALGLPTAWMIDEWRVRVLESHSDRNPGAW